MKTRNKLLLAAGAAAGAAWWLSRRRRWPGFQDRVVLITGASRGLGLALAREFARRGARLAICSRRADDLKRAASELSAMGADVFSKVCDVSDRAQVQELVAAVSARFGRIDVLVNNAGIIQVGPLDSMTHEDFEAAMNTHYWGPLHASLAVVPGMRRGGGGRIVNIASIGGKISVPHLLPYTASKFALVGLSEGLRAELARDRIWVTTVCPGMMRTGSPRNATFKGKHRREYAWFAVSGSVPIASAAAARAARRIVEACRRGDPEVFIGLSAQIGARLHGLFPGLSSLFLSVLNRLLPTAGGVGTGSRLGHESESAVTSALVSGSSRKAEVEYHQR